MQNLGFSLNPGETVVRIVHRHIINLVPVIAAAVIVLAALAAASVGVAANTAAVAKVVNPSAVQSGILVLTALIVLIVIVAYLIYRQNRIILTSQNLCQITQYGLFGRTLAKLNLNDVQDVTGRRVGVFATIFNYGDLVVETAGEQENFVFTQAPDPTGLAAIINQTYREFCEATKPGVKPPGQL